MTLSKDARDGLAGYLEGGVPYLGMRSDISAALAEIDRLEGLVRFFDNVAREQSWPRPSPDNEAG